MFEATKIITYIVLFLLAPFGILPKQRVSLEKEILPEGKVISQTEHKVPLKLDAESKVTLRSRAAVFVDSNSGEILAEKNKDHRLPMASTTKLVTALVVLAEMDENTVVTVPDFNVRPFESTMGLTPGDKITIKELLHGLLICSGGDAASTLAIANAKSEAAFVEKMNKFASTYELENTHFTNPAGYDEPKHYSSAYDLSRMAKLAIANQTIKGIVAKKSYTAKSTSGKKYFLLNTNQLIDTSFRGIKTGTTDLAGECLISLYEEGGREIIGVVLNSPDRFLETTQAIRWAREAFSW